MQVIWLLILISSMIIEALTFNLVTIWVALGALIAYISSWFISNSSIQITIFLITTLVSLFSTQKLVKKFVNKYNIKTNLDDVVGKYGTVIEDIKKDSKGVVKVLGKDWTAISDDNKLIRTKTNVKILRIEGVKLVVRKDEE